MHFGFEWWMGIYIVILVYIVILDPRYQIWSTILYNISILCTCNTLQHFSVTSGYISWNVNYYYMWPWFYQIVSWNNCFHEWPVAVSSNSSLLNSHCLNRIYSWSWLFSSSLAFQDWHFHCQKQWNLWDGTFGTSSVCLQCHLEAIECTKHLYHDGAFKCSYIMMANAENSLFFVFKWKDMWHELKKKLKRKL